MILIERHIITKTSKEFKPLDELCKLSKNLYNSVLYTGRQYYFEAKNKFELINHSTFFRKAVPNTFSSGYGIQVCSTPAVFTVKFIMLE